MERLKPEKMFHRIGEIWNIDHNKLKPAVVSDSKLSDDKYGNYNPTQHKIHINPRKEEYQQILDHELIHSAHEILESSPRIPLPQRAEYNRRKSALRDLGVYDEELQDELKREIYAELAHPELNGTRMNQILDLSAGLPNPKTIARFVEMIVQNRPARYIFERHGVDGLILLMINPPKTWGYIEIMLWHRRVLKDALLDDIGGLTENGIKYIKSKLTREDILVKLKVAEYNRNGDFMSASSLTNQYTIARRNSDFDEINYLLRNHHIFD